MSAGNLVQDAAAGGWWRFGAPRAVLVARRLDEVLPVLEQVLARVEGERLWAAGYIAYEAGPAFEPAVHAHPPGELPLLWFGLHDEPRLVQLDTDDAEPPVYHWTPSVERDEYDRAIARVRALIEAGDTYQINYTMRLRARAVEPPETLFRRMVRANRPGHSAYLDCGRHVVCSASPELFLELDGDRLESRPMKGTAGRGRYAAEDRARAAALAASVKNRAENLMIVDMVRNDLGRISATGSVKVPALFALERYPTVWQMTSTVEARTDASLPDILRALFPPASITGAPKARTSEIIAELESTPRGVYTGAVGWIAPGRRAQFNVAIRTAVFDRDTGEIEYGVGGGIVWDSTSEAEYEEALLKARIVTDIPPAFSLLETMLWQPGEGYALLDEHLARLVESADYLDVPVTADAARAALDRQAAELPPAPHRVRLLVGRDGVIRTEAVPLGADAAAPVRLAIAAEAIDAGNPFLYNKTTHRVMYEQARGTRTDCDDVVLWNRRGEVTETCIANLVVELDGRRVTPPVASGLLGGTFRARLLAGGEVAEQVVTLDDLRRATRLWVVNSVRGWREAVLVG